MQEEVFDEALLCNKQDPNEIYALYKIQLPDEYTEEEKQLQKEFALLRQARKNLQELKSKLKEDKLKDEEEKLKVIKPSAEAKEEAKKLLKSGAITLSSAKDKHGKKKNKDYEESRLSDDEDTPSNSYPSKLSPSKKVKSLYDSFVSTSAHKPASATEEPERRGAMNLEEEATTLLSPSKTDRKRKQHLISRDEPVAEKYSRIAPVYHERKEEEEADIDRPHRRQETSEERPYGRMAGKYSSGYRQSGPPTKGNTLRVNCYDINREFLEKVFSPFGVIVNINVDVKKSQGFVSMETPEVAAAALKELGGGAYIDNRCVDVSYARKQPSFSGAQDLSTEVWTKSTVDRSTSRDRKPSRSSPPRKEGDESPEIDRGLVRYDAY